MTGLDIKEKVERYINGIVDDNIIIDGIQEAINHLGIKGRVVDTIEVEAESGEVYDLPSDIIRVIKVEIKDENKYYYNYMIDGLMIRFQEEGIYTIYAKKHPFVVGNINIELELHPILENCVLDYVKGFAKLVFDDNSVDGLRLTEKFERDSLQAYNVLNSNKRGIGKVRVVR